MTAPSKRRWFRFSLRTMFVVVTVIGVYIGWQLKIVRERKDLLAELKSIASDKYIYVGLESSEYNAQVDLQRYRVPLIRRLLGDESCLQLTFSTDCRADLIGRAEAAFPESRLYMIMPGENYIIADFRDSLKAPAETREANIGSAFKTGLIEK